MLDRVGVFFYKRLLFPFRDDARVAQLVEQRIENPRVGGSNPPPGTIFPVKDNRLASVPRLCSCLSDGLLGSPPCTP